VRLGVALAAAAIVAASAAPRIALAAGVLPEPLRPFVWSDPLLVYLRGLSGHHLPYADTPFEYPPLIGLLSAIASLLSPTALVFVTVWAVLQVAAAGAVAALLASAAGPGRTLRRFVLMPELLLLGAVNFDLVAVAFLCAAFVAARGRQELHAGLHLALGTLTKLFPIVAAPVLLLRARRPVQVAIAAVLVLMAGFIPASFAGRTAALGPAYYLVGIPANLDSPWGLVAGVLSALGVPAAQTVVAAVTLVGLAVTYAALVLPRARVRDPVVAMGLALIVSLVWWRLYSPQYSLWVLPLFVLLPLRTRILSLLVAGDALVFVSVYPLTLVRWTPGDWIQSALLATLVVGVAVRLLALIGTARQLTALGSAGA
jgi:glycosyl transferase family 87